jgi:hypothetical protein
VSALSARKRDSLLCSGFDVHLVITKLDFHFSSLNMQRCNYVTCLSLRKQHKVAKICRWIDGFSQSQGEKIAEENEAKSDRFNYANFMRHQFVLIDHWLRISIWTFLSFVRRFFPLKNWDGFGAGCVRLKSSRFAAFIFAGRVQTSERLFVSKEISKSARKTEIKKWNVCE